MDLDCLIKYTQLIYNIVAILAFASIIWGFFSYIVTKKQLYGSTMSRCIDIYRNKFVPMELDTDRNQASDYVDFVNEELFYFEKEFIPKDVMTEWIDGMINYVPIFRNRSIANHNYCLQKINEHDLYDYPRVRKIFSVNGNYNFELIHSKNYDDRILRRKERDRLIKEIMTNILK